MSQSGFTPISLYYSATTTNVPTSGNLAAGELALNTADGKLFYKDSSNVVQVLGTKGGVGSSTTTQVMYNSSGLVVGSANLTFNGTTLSANALALTTALPVASGGTGVTTSTGSGNNVLSTSPTLVTPALGTPSALVGTNITGTAAGLTAGSVTTNANLTGPVTSVGNATTIVGPIPAVTLSGAISGGGNQVNNVIVGTSRVNPRTFSVASTSTLTPDISSYDQYNLTAQAATLTVAAPTGTPVDGNKLIIRILDNGVAQTISWNATYTVIGVTLPTSTTITKMAYIGCIYNSANTRWDVVAVNTQ